MIAQKVANITRNHFPKEEGSSIIAIGISVYPVRTETGKELIKLSDQAMYQSKNLQIDFHMAKTE